jgi:tetratricopeptide (TPR) repeat protein
MPVLDIDKVPEIRRVFVGRRRELKLFEDAAHSIPNDRCSLLVFHGVGGRGKTWLCEKIRDTCRDDPNYASLIVGHLDLHAKPDAAKRDDLMALIYVRNAFAEQKVSFPVFDLALALAWQANRSEEPFPSLKNPWLRRTTGAADDLTAEGADDVKDWLSGESVASLIGDEIGKIPLVGTLLTRGGRWMISKAKIAWLHSAHDDLARLYLPESRQLKTPEQLQRLLPYMLAVDLNRAGKEKPGCRLVLLIDEYERVLEQGGSGDDLFENRFDAAIRALLGHCDGLLAVVFGRERLPWRRGDPVGALLDGHQNELLGLSLDEADEYLRAVGVGGQELRAAIVQGATETADSVYPLLLELQVEHWAVRTGMGRTPQAEDFRLDDEAFQLRLQAMVARFLRDYGDPMRATLNRLAFLRRFDKACFRFVLTEFATGLPLESFDRLTRLSFVREAGNGWLALHGRVADALAQMKDEVFALETRGKLFGHFDTRATAESNLTVTDAHVEALSEAQAIRHEMQGFESGYAVWLYARVEPIELAARYFQCQPFWELARDRLIATLGPDHPDVATTLNNLAGLHRAQGRYDEALPLYQRALGISEKALGPDHPSVATTLNNLAGLHGARGRYVEALPLIERAIVILKRAFPAGHPNVETVQANLAALLRHMD